MSDVIIAHRLAIREWFFIGGSIIQVVHGRTPYGTD
jgi:hypothetical protein